MCDVKQTNPNYFNRNVKVIIFKELIFQEAFLECHYQGLDERLKKICFPLGRKINWVKVTYRSKKYSNSHKAVG